MASQVAEQPKVRAIASKEEATKAFESLNAIRYALTDAALRALQEELNQLYGFLTVSKAKLPTAAAYARDRKRKRVKA